jgi:hypothetical protein
MMNRRAEPSYLALATESPMLEGYVAMLEAQALTQVALNVDTLPSDVFTGHWLSSERSAAAAELADATRAHSRASSVPVARSDEVATAFKRAFMVLKRVSVETAAALCAQSCEVEWCDDDDDDDAPEPFASLLFLGGPLDGLADGDGGGRLTESTLGSCHQCKRKTIIRRCQRQRSASATLSEEARPDVNQVCGRAFCSACVKKYPPLDENGHDTSGVFCCPTCRGLCSCRACSRARVGGPKKLKGRPEEWIGRETQGRDPSSAGSPAAAETTGGTAVQALRYAPSGELLSLAEACDDEAAPRDIDLDSSVDHLSQAADLLPPSYRSCRASCPACQHRHKLRIAFCAPPKGARVLVPYKCVKCARAFGLIVATCHLQQ